MNDFNKYIYKRDYYKYLNLRKKYLVNNANIYFNLECKRHNITPRYAILKNRVYNNSGRYSKRQYEKNRINNEIKFLQKKKQFLNIQLYNLELTNMNNFQEFWHIIKSQMLDKLSKFIHTKYENLNQKIKHLIANKANKNICKPERRPIFSFHDSIKNLSNISFSNDEIHTLENNFKSKFDFGKKQDILDNTIVQSEAIIKNNQHKDQNLLRYQISNIIQTHLEKENIHTHTYTHTDAYTNTTVNTCMTIWCN